MTRTTLHVARLLLLSLTVSCGAMFAGAYNDYEGCDWECEQRLEAVSHHCLDDRINYEKTGILPESHKECELELVPSKVSTRLIFEADVDPRVEQVRLFFVRHKCPVAHLAPMFVKVADDNNLDWRLLPVIALLESGGGRQARHHNIFGWNSGRTQFTSVEEGIGTVAHALSTMKCYRNKTTYQKLRTYNVHVSYARHAILLMDQLSAIQLNT